MNLSDFLRRLVPGKRRAVVRESAPLRVTPWNLGHALTMARLTCATCRHTWVEVGPAFVVAQDCPKCHAAIEYVLPLVEPSDLGCDGPWLTGEFDMLLTVASRQHTGG